MGPLQWLERFVRGALHPLTHSLEILHHTDARLVVQSDYGTMTFDRNYKTISRSGRVIARFGDIRQVEIKVYRDEGRALHWAVRLRVAWWRSVPVDMTVDEVSASICAAHINTIMDQPVVIR